jgi:hypothetical protein
MRSLMKRKTKKILMTRKKINSPEDDICKNKGTQIITDSNSIKSKTSQNKALSKCSNRMMKEMMISIRKMRMMKRKGITLEKEKRKIHGEQIFKMLKLKLIRQK